MVTWCGDTRGYLTITRTRFQEEIVFLYQYLTAQNYLPCLPLLYLAINRNVNVIFLQQFEHNLHFLKSKLKDLPTTE